jgi:mono/diheme cytochrome c family protein
MRSRCLIPAVAVLLVALGAAAPLAAQAPEPFTIDSSAASFGEHVFNTRECTGCHGLGRESSSGPDLIGVTERRTVEWLRRFLKNPIEMAHEDETAYALQGRYGSQMPNLNLSKRDIEGLINFFALATAERRAKQSKP